MYDDFDREDFDNEAGETEALNEEDVVDGLRALLRGEPLENTLLESVTHTVTFSEGGYLTWDKGFALHMADGSVFQVTVKQEC